METTGTPTFDLAVSSHDLVQAAKVFDDTGPFTTVYLTTEPSIDNASHRSELRWKDLARTLQAQGAPDETLDAIAALVPDAHLQGATLVVVAGRGGVLLEEHASALKEAGDSEIP